MKIIPFNIITPKISPVANEEEFLTHSDETLHQHKEMQVTLILKGKGQLTVGDYSQAFKSGDVYLIGANQHHKFEYDMAYVDGVDNDVDAVHLNFDFKRIPETFFLLQELNAIRKFISSCITGFQLPITHELEAALLIQTVSNKTGLERLLGLLEIFHFFASIGPGWKPLSKGFYNYSFSKSEGNRMNDVFKYTLDNYAEDITLNKIASIAHITPQAFCKYFKQHTRKTYNNFLNEVRVNEACKKIISGSYDGLSTIAYKTGFKGASNFNRVFKKTTGMSPSDYKKEFRHKTA